MADNGSGGGNSAAVVAILVIFLVVIAAGVLAFRSGMFGGKTNKIDINVTTPKK